jgi:CRISPR-associated Csx2 family protein
MPTTVVSFLGTGQKQNRHDSRSGYRTTTYRFTRSDGGEFLSTTSLFGTALIRFLRETNVAIDRWIVLGTGASLWSELNQVLPKPDEVLEQYCQIDDRVLARNVDQTAIKDWQQTLNEHAAPLELRLCLTGEALVQDSQMQIAKALFENIPRDNDIVFDISHGFRHQPVIATFLISLMRWTHHIRSVRFFSGVFEARQGDVTPVLEMPICQELVNATEAAATLALTGNFEPLARCLGHNAEMAWFLENTNQLGNARTQARHLRNLVTHHDDAVKAELATLLQERLQWSDGDRFADRVLETARTALDRKDYLRAVILAYEALVIKAIQVLHLNADPMNYQIREQTLTWLFAHLRGDDRELLTDLQHARNACAHGSRSDRASVQQVLGRPQEFRSLIERTFTLFDRLPQLLAS